MIGLALEDVMALCPGRLVRGSVGPLSAVEIDSRRAGPGALFVAIGGGAAYVDDALARGAIAALVPDDAFAAMAALGRAVRERSRAQVVAVTGSAGKTSTKDILAALCRPHREVVAAAESHNNEIGVPLTLTRLTESTDVAIVEMGMRGTGQIHELCELARPTVGVITNVGPAHLELLGTLDAVAAAKAELVAALPPGGTAVVPADAGPLEPYLHRTDVRVVRFGPGGNVSLRSLRREGRGARVEVEVDGTTVKLDLSFTARHLVANTLAAVAAYVALGLPLDRVGDGAAGIELTRWRSEERRLPGGGLLVNDCYNANPLSAAAAVAHLAEHAGARRRVAILGVMAELGPDAPRYHREVGAACARAGVDVLVVVGELAREYAAGAVAAGGSPEIHEVRDAEEAARLAPTIVRPGDAVLVKASRAAGLEAVGAALAGVAA
jgi:UDP-N-acetylmuramoyl-tripeptide--D-alanyl-D-alanine ligase